MQAVFVFSGHWYFSPSEKKDISFQQEMKVKNTENNNLIFETGGKKPITIGITKSDFLKHIPQLHMTPHNTIQRDRVNRQ